MRAAALSDEVAIRDGEQVMRVVAPKGSNLVEVRGREKWREGGGVR